eukprot:CAMPEP_0201869070 /NCGR_PEP_ID=MMETSP0902-20130614/2724_1 /ASSEMBLY_ACC=CAM_ASM_000551 /TAXON_ID=420261 /ORGANISM="Thalassiosira antarctica, Strain CCMP982" /LENGTH=618 /DNA_ID=CAMNT_0048394511 /DNA_START=248 /DNA_END=2104 /DNA_ORIENTATION=-
MTSRHRFVVACCCFILPSILVTNALLQTLPRECALRRSHGIPPSPTSTSRRNAFFNDGNNKTPPQKNNVNLYNDKVNGSASSDLFKTLELKDEALMQAQMAVGSLEKALGSAVTNLEGMQQQLQIQMNQMEQELETTQRELSSTQTELERTKAELEKTQAELSQSREESNQLEMALAQSKEAADRAEELEAYVNDMMEDEAPPPAPKKEPDNPWQLFSSSPKVIPVLNEWIAIKGANEGEFQISGKVTNHPTIPDGDAIITSPLTDPGKAREKKIVTTVSGSKYRLGDMMTMPASDAASVKITSPKKKKSPQQLIKARSSISIPDMTGNTLGNGRYLLAGDAEASINGRSYIQTAYRSSPFGTKPMGEPLVIKYSPNKEAMKREYANYQKVSSGLKRGSFIRRVEFLPVAGSEMPDQSALVMQRGVADVKAFMPKVGGRLEGELLMDCALTALRCVEALHSVKLVWNDLKTENFVVIEDQRGGVSFRGIDLESCMPVKNPPVDYTPEACPPEFARSFLEGEANTFSLEYSYDVWSYGMFLYEISTGRGFFDGYSAEKITKSLPTFQPNIDKVEDPVMADLIGQCLSRNPTDRPSVARIFNHPFFESTSKNPFDFLFGI